MGRKQYTEEQIAFALRQAESGTPVAEIIRRLGVSEQTFYRWKKQFAGLGIAEMWGLRTLEEENRKLKRLVTDLIPIPTINSAFSRRVRDRRFG